MKRHRLDTDSIFNLAMRVWCVLLACLVLQATLITSHPVHMYRAIGHNIRHFSCTGKSSSTHGVCMFAWDCIKANGTHLGTCIDRFYFGSCCQVQGQAPIIEIPDSVKVPSNAIDNDLVLPASLPTVHHQSSTVKVTPEVVTSVVTSSSVEDSQSSSSSTMDTSSFPSPSAPVLQSTAEPSTPSTEAPPQSPDDVSFTEASSSVESASQNVEEVQSWQDPEPNKDSTTDATSTWSDMDVTAEMIDDVTAQLLNVDNDRVTPEEVTPEMLLTSDKTTGQPPILLITSPSTTTSTATSTAPSTPMAPSTTTSTPAPTSAATTTSPTTTSTSTTTSTPTTTSTSTTTTTTTTTERPTPTITAQSTTELPITTTQDSFDASKLTEADYESACGRQLYKARPQGRIVNGQKSEFGEWPWQISLRQWKRTTFMHKCGAALLNENWAITAAHCVDSVPPEDLLLRIGEFDLSSNGEGLDHVERRVQIMTTHPEFNSRTFENDLALLRFYEPVTFRENIIPICLPTTNDTFVNKTGFVTGWGRLYVDGPLPNILQEVQVPVITNLECEQEYRKAGFLENIPDIFLCAGYDEGGRDSCEGDSGGPLVIRQENNRWLLAGIISWGIGCAEPHQPGVYTRISKFRDWINQILVF